MVFKLAAIKPGFTAATATLAAIVADGVSFSGTITLGAALIAVAVGIGTLVSIVYGVRYKQAANILAVERTAQEEKADRLEEELGSCRIEHEAYREAKHLVITDLRTQLLSKEAELELEAQKHDYTQVVAQMKEMHDELTARTELFNTLIAGQKKSQEVLDKLLATVSGLLDRVERGS